MFIKSINKLFFLGKKKKKKEKESLPQNEQKKKDKAVDKTVKPEEELDETEFALESEPKYKDPFDRLPKG